MSPADRRRPESPEPIAFAPELMHAHAAEAAQLLKALGNEQRLHILCNLLDGALSVGELNQRLELSQSALSQHLALLREMELVETRRDGKQIYYRIASDNALALIGFLCDQFSDSSATQEAV